MRDTGAFEHGPTSSTGRHPYFAYGVNMDAAEMVWRCPQALLQGPAQLRAHRFVINQRGVATVVRDAGATVHGLVWDLTGTDLAALDGFKGVSQGFYTREAVDVLTEKGVVVRAAIYVAANATPGQPRPGYLERIIGAARECGFPTDYLEVLEACGKTGNSSS